MKTVLWGTFNRLEEILGGAVLAVMCVMATLQAGSRFISKVAPTVKPVYWTEEACTILFVWLCFVGASLALRTGDHFAVEILREKLPPRIGRPVQFGTAVCVALFALLLVWFGVALTVRSWRVMTPALEIPKSYAYAAVPVGGALMLIRAVEALWALRPGARPPTVA